jgi:lipoyl(octanoyl) transferase
MLPFNDEKEHKMNNFCQIQWLGRVDYQSILQMQRELVAQRTTDEIPDTLLLVEHPPTFTLGTDAHREHLLMSGQELARHKIAYHTVDRSGSVNYHCPGQLVVYPILKLTKTCYNYHTYIEMLENVIIRALASFKVRGFRQQGQRGIWVFSPQGMGYGDEVAKIGSAEVKVNRDSITSHSFWLNVNPNLQFFDLIVPSGVSGGNVTSLRKILNKSIDISEVIRPLVKSFYQVFQTESMPAETITIPKYEPALHPSVKI